MVCCVSKVKDFRGTSAEPVASTCATLGSDGELVNGSAVEGSPWEYG